MSKIKISDIKPTGVELFNDSESFMNELNDSEVEQAMGGLIAYPYPTIVSIQHSCNCGPIIGGGKTTILTTGPYTPVIL